jgi:2-dehydro-3-deoxy-D-arabinonate dehydratase
MRICKLQLPTGETAAGVLEDSQVRLLRSPRLSDYLHAATPALALEQGMAGGATIPLAQAKLLAPLDEQEVWAAGVTYKRSKEERERESVGAARFYDLVYSADRPELFFKAPAQRVSGPGQPVHIRRDSRWSVPEPELALVLSPQLELVGFTIGNDMSARDIEGENPLYLPQAKVFDRACAVGPCITLADAMPGPDNITISLKIERAGKAVFDGSAQVAAMKRSFQELIDWLGRELSFPRGAVLLTGTCVVPPDDFTLAVGDLVHIDITGIGRLSNPVQSRV